MPISYQIMNTNDEISEKLTAVANQIEKIGTDTVASVSKLETRVAAMEEDKEDKEKKEKEAAEKEDKEKKDKEGMTHKNANDDKDKKMKEMEEKNASMAEDIKRLNAMASQPRIDSLKHAYKDMVDEEALKTKVANWEKMSIEELNAAYETVQPFIRSTESNTQNEWQMPPASYGQDNDALITLEASDADTLAMVNAEVIQ